MKWLLCLICLVVSGCGSTMSTVVTVHDKVPFSNPDVSVTVTVSRTY